LSWNDACRDQVRLVGEIRMNLNISDVLQKAYEKRKKALMEEFEALSEQITRVLSAGDKIRIERELKKIKEEMHLVDKLLREVNMGPEFEQEFSTVHLM